MSRFGSIALAGSQESARQGLQQGQRASAIGAEATRAAEARGAATSRTNETVSRNAAEAARLKAQGGAAIGAGIASFGQSFKDTAVLQFQARAKLELEQTRANLASSQKAAFEAEAQRFQLDVTLGSLQGRDAVSLEGLKGDELQDATKKNTEAGQLRAFLEEQLGTIEEPRRLSTVARARATGQVANFERQRAQDLEKAGIKQTARLSQVVQAAENHKQTLRTMNPGMTANLTRGLTRMGDFFKGQDDISAPAIINLLFSELDPFFAIAAEKTSGVGFDNHQENLAGLVKRINRGEISVGLIGVARDGIHLALQKAGPDSLETLMAGESEAMKATARDALRQFDRTLQVLENTNRHTPGIDGREILSQVTQAAIVQGVDINDPDTSFRIKSAIAEVAKFDERIPMAILSPDPEVSGPAVDMTFKLTGLGPEGDAGADGIRAVGEVQRELGLRSESTAGLPTDQIPRRERAEKFLQGRTLPDLTATERQQAMSSGELFDFSGKPADVFARGVKTAATTPFGVAGATFDLGVSALSALTKEPEGPKSDETKQQTLNRVLREGRARKLRSATAKTEAGKALLSEVAVEASQAGLLRPATMKILGGQIERGELTGAILLKFIRGAGSK